MLGHASRFSPVYVVLAALALRLWERRTSRFIHTGGSDTVLRSTGDLGHVQPASVRATSTAFGYAAAFGQIHLTASPTSSGCSDTDFTPSLLYALFGTTLLRTGYALRSCGTFILGESHGSPCVRSIDWVIHDSRFRVETIPGLGRHSAPPGRWLLMWRYLKQPLGRRNTPPDARSVLASGYRSPARATSSPHRRLEFVFLSHLRRRPAPGMITHGKSFPGCWASR